MYITPQDSTPVELYQLLTGGIVPRPIAWISTQNAQGLTNLAPYSFFSVASCNPPVLTFTNVPSRDIFTKDTLANLQETKECVVHIVPANQADLMNASCASYSSSQSEIDEIGIETVASHKVNPPSIKSAAVRYECTLKETITISDKPIGGVLVLLDVVAIHVDESVMKDNIIQANLLDTIGKLGGNDYCHSKADINLPRP
ncbi:flavin reductase family protein [Thiomicrorhabdus sp. Milos-T2]|uniref:flavin reductase family protein n=1 Tax=Thiomicrorhabdus sp. Milos-T2 TaxID=90814 RepID=UPI00049423C1|nr:flavin reductase family protein [Thiomicrorhabdus sp. Milos-T2]